jgi:hypothetical protein
LYNTPTEIRQELLVETVYFVPPEMLVIPVCEIGDIIREARIIITADKNWPWQARLCIISDDRYAVRGGLEWQGV